MNSRRFTRSLVGACSSEGGIVSPRALAVIRIDDEIELGRLLDRDVGWLCPRRILST